MTNATFCRAVLMTCIALFLSSCASGPRTVNISEAELQKRMAEQLAVPITLLKIFDIGLSNPVIRLDSGTERLHAQMDTSLSSPLGGSPLMGKINVSGRLGFDPASNSIILKESRIEQIDMQGLDAQQNAAFSLIVGKIGEVLLTDVPLYSLKPEELTVGSRRYTPNAFNFRGNSLQVTLTPQ